MAHGQGGFLLATLFVCDLFYFFATTLSVSSAATLFWLSQAVSPIPYARYSPILPDSGRFQWKETLHVSQPSVIAKAMMKLPISTEVVDFMRPLCCLFTRQIITDEQKAKNRSSTSSSARELELSWSLSGRFNDRFCNTNERMVWREPSFHRWLSESRIRTRI